MSELAVGNFLTFREPNPSTSQLGNYMPVSYYFQNFFINQAINYDGNSHTFLPFGFSGVTINRTADGTDASLTFPNNSLSRAWADDAIKSRWFVQVDVVIVETPTLVAPTTANRVHQYFGQVSGGKWDQVALVLSVGTILDAVGADIPRRSLTQSLVGSLPVTSNVRLQ